MQATLDRPDDVNALISYFTKTPEPILASKICAIFQNYDTENRRKICDWLIDNQERRFGIDIPAIYRAVNESGAVRNRGEYVKAEKITCECCGLEYQFVLESSDQLRAERGIHDYCPRCGISYTDTVSAKKYFDMGHNIDWYYRMVKEAKEKHCAPGTKWRYDKRGDDADISIQNQAKAERLLARLNALN